ncbi:MAG: cation transporter [Deltaproteobacteria bacterium RIFCSPLOWO2_12_FULL_44_12]|nr:MAG: cation transporter [Deltaproteobacteria bacterium RIFCSPHIGHO2_01_FULL_43_49]OGQ15208.1 MAG: cation transporter [Deltaproteobacteria bacterium RIFCSPHIGHO2_02_FULL_44_53]OGQ27169.1 MAG: cation transporter [Deltaproteobacteria bacterium RIFCSPHIGHO2_12_FULL_44_21]OGQ31725.1 MAG: cation transporter [Deltaproteobacteria bacterium RIFCSPLOWO2_01_FULL_45_74]OGQ42925.1 MAG: cation transporter [Deltaproteobacteria bacterium RIFCSPLOWO2_02_FULL_44_34]OGQ69962.1 MAG: cation transporter [Deltapr
MIERIIKYCSEHRGLVLFFVGLGMVWSFVAIKNLKLDAIPDLSDTQVIIFTEWEGRSPDLVESQITYPIISQLISAPKVKVARGISMFGESFIYVIFQDGTDIYWARSRVLEYLNGLSGRLPQGVSPQLGPDATGVGWIFEYALVDTSGKHDLAELRTFQDWYLRYWLAEVPGVAEVAAIGGFIKQYQVDIDPNALAAYSIPLKDVVMAIQNSNNDVGGRLLEMSGREYAIRGRGYIKSLADIENVVVKTNGKGTPVLVKNIAAVHWGGDLRRGAADLDGMGEVVGGIVVMRHGENPMEVIHRIKKKLEQVQSAFPEGVEYKIAYDRSELIHRSISTLIQKLLEELIVVSLVIVIFLWHFKSALVPIISLPVAVLFSFIPMYHFGITSNIMSLGGIAIAIGAMVDAAIIMVENAHKKMEVGESILSGLQEVGRPIFFSLLVIAVSFMPVFVLEAQEGRLFKPLAFTKNFSMFFAAILAITLVPLLMRFFLKGGKIISEEKHPFTPFLHKHYTRALDAVLKYPKRTIKIAVATLILTIPVFMRLGSEFMPPLNEGDFLYMPTTFPGISIEEAKNWLQAQDKIIKQFPEVERVFGKVGRANTSTDPAPLSMVETVIKLKPMKEWKTGRSWEKLEKDLYEALSKIPGTSNALLPPIRVRIDMLTTGIRTPVGIKIAGSDNQKIDEIGEHIEKLLKEFPGTRSVLYERINQGYYIDFDIKRDQIARYGLTIDDVEMVIQSAVGGENVTTTVEGRERYPVNVRYFPELRNDLDRLKHVLVTTPMGAKITMQMVADVKIVRGPSMVKDENGMLNGWVYIDLIPGSDMEGYVKKVKKFLGQNMEAHPGYTLNYTGQYEYLKRAKERLMWAVPLTLFIIVLLLYWNSKSWVKTGIILLAVPFSLVGAFWILWVLGYNLSVAVWIGIIALAGVDAETGVVMLLYLDLAYEKMVGEGKMREKKDLLEAIHHGAVKRLRPKLMTVACLILGLAPIMWSGLHESGADVMKRIAAPMIGGILTSFGMELFLYPVIFLIWKGRKL